MAFQYSYPPRFKQLVAKVHWSTLLMIGLGIWALVDLIIIVCGAFTDKDGLKVFQWMEPGA